ncbi:hypothetical protein DNTS_016923 [Danionella cerebrum]|uniref:C-type lectin domain-containing protein n=1 Tax=Danionella cerebrum TaxID=2873325 RepID=A0A553QFZ1_9TELE|nr:hypothetical protein DNTS_016923 [Danionella translucida]
MKTKTTGALFLLLELCGVSSGLLKRHFYVNVKKAWADARQYCQHYYQDLSSFTDSLEETQFLNDAGAQSSNAWIGLRREAGVWMWSGGQNASVMSSGEQNVNSNCVFVKKSDQMLYVDNCSGSHAFFCMTTYAVVQENMTWEGALEYCRQHHFDLASLNSTTKMDAASGQMNQAQTQLVWVGLRFLAGRWFWLSGDHLDLAGSSGFPEHQCPAANLRCGAVDTHKKTWMARDCEEQLGFICQ